MIASLGKLMKFVTLSHFSSIAALPRSQLFIALLGAFFVSAPFLGLTSSGLTSIALAQSGERQNLTIFTSDPRDVILEVYVNEEFRPVLSRSGNSVNVELTNRPAPGSDVDCRVILEVVLASRDRRKQPTDLCAVDFQVTLSSGGIGGAVATSTSPATAPSSTIPQSAPQGPPQAPPQASPEALSAAAGSQDPANGPQAPAAGSGNLAPIQGGNNIAASADPSSFRWSFGADMTAATLVHGASGTGDFDFTARCQLQTGLIDITLPTPTTAFAGPAPLITLQAGLFAKSYSAGADPATTAVVRFQVSSADELWMAIIREANLIVSHSDGSMVSISLSGSANPTRAFVAACGQGATLPPLTGALTGGSTARLAGDLTGQNRLSCADFGTIRSQGQGPSVTLRFTNRQPRPVLVNWIDYDGRPVIYATVETGESYDQPTFVGHVWLVTWALEGQCIGLYEADGRQNEIIVGSAGAVDGTYSAPALQTPALPAPTSPAPLNLPSQTRPPLASAPLTGPGSLRPPGSLTQTRPVTPTGPPMATGPMAPTVPIQPNRTNQAPFATSFTYACNDGRTLRVTFDQRQNSATISDGLSADVVLYPARTNSGFRYSDQVRELTGRGQRIFWNDGRGPTVCFEQ